MARRGQARHGRDWQTRLGLAGRGKDWLGMVRHLTQLVGEGSKEASPFIDGYVNV